MIIGNSIGAVTLTDNTTVIEGTITGNASAYAGFYAAVFGPGDTNYNVVVSGAVESTGSSRVDVGILLESPGEVSNDGLIKGGAGVLIAGYSGISYVRNAGLIEATQGNGVFTNGEAGLANIGTIMAAGIGVDLRGGGTFYNAGSVTGLVGAVIATYYGTGSIYNADLIRGTLGDGAILAGTLTNLSVGTVVGTQNGLYLYTQGAVLNAGLISGSSNGILTGGGSADAVTLATTIVNTGLIKGDADGIALANPDAATVDIFNNPGGTIAGALGIDVSSGVGPTLLIGNDGLITGGVTFQYGVLINTGSIYGSTAAYLDSGYIINGNRLVGGATGAICGGITIDTSIKNGIVEQTTIYGAIRLNNTGYISGTQSGIILMSGGIIGNSGEINSSNGTAIESGGAGLRLTNVGKIYAAGDAVQAGGNAYIVNTSNIIADGDAISLSGSSSVYNFGFIDSRNDSAIILGAGGRLGNGGAIAATAGTAIQSNAALIFVNTGPISAADIGVQIEGAAQIVNTFNIITGGDALLLSGVSSIYNLGFIESQGSDAVSLAAGGVVGNGGTFDTGNGVAIKSGAALRLVNTGLIKGTTAAIESAGSAYIYNSLNILAVGDAISVAGYLSLHNKGFIQSGTATAIVASAGSIYNAGIINGSTAISLTSPGTIDNSATGTISGTVALSLCKGSVLYNSGLILGGLSASVASTINNMGVIDAAGENTVSLEGIVNGLGTIELGQGPMTIGGQVATGQQIDFSGGQETLALPDPRSFSAVLDNFSVTDEIDLSGIVRSSITGESFVAGVLTLNEAAGFITLTFGNPGSLNGDTFNLSAQGNGTGITLSAAPRIAFATAASSTVFTLDSAVVPVSGISYVTQSATPFASLAQPAGWLNYPLFAPTPFESPITLQP